MTITITEKEFLAINAVYNQVALDYEAASDEVYLKTMGEELRLVSCVLNKWNLAKKKAENLKIIKAVIKQKKRTAGEKIDDIDKLARLILRESESMSK